MSRRSNVSILSGQSTDQSSSYLIKNKSGISNFLPQYYDINYIIYNNIYNNYLQFYLDGNFTSIDEQEQLIETIIELAKSVDQVISVVLLDSLSVVQRGLLLYKENVALRQRIEALEKQLEECKVQKPQFRTAAIEASVEVDVSLDLKYLFYVKEYGPPVNGLFDSRKLAEVINKYNLFDI